MIANNIKAEGRSKSLVISGSVVHIYIDVYATLLILSTERNEDNEFFSGESSSLSEFKRSVKLLDLKT